MTAPITDLTVLVGKDTQAPPGFTKIPYDLNRGAGGNFIWLCYKRTVNALKDDCITGLEVLIGKGAKESSGFKKINVNLNRGTGRRSNFIYLAYEKAGKNDPIKDIIVLNDGDPNHPPKGYQIIPKDLNRGAGGDTIHLAFLRGEEDEISNWGELPEGISLELFKKVLEPSSHFVQEISRWQSDIDKQTIWTQRLEKTGPEVVQAHEKHTFGTEVYAGTREVDAVQWEVKVGVNVETSATIGAEASGVKGSESISFEYDYIHRTTFTKEEYRKVTEQVEVDPRDYGYRTALVQFINRLETFSLPRLEHIATVDAHSSILSRFTTGKDGKWEDIGIVQAVEPPVYLKKTA